MGPHRLLEELLGVARKLGVEVRMQPFRAAVRSAGGLCRLRGRIVVLIDQHADPYEKARTLADALGEFDLEGVYLMPEARALIETARARRG